jgi:hypothetical protein
LPLSRATPMKKTAAATDNRIAFIFNMIDPLCFLELDYGARYLRISCSSSALSMALTRMCRITAFTSRGDRSCGAW